MNYEEHKHGDYYTFETLLDKTIIYAGSTIYLLYSFTYFFPETRDSSFIPGLQFGTPNTYLVQPAT